MQKCEEARGALADLIFGEIDEEEEAALCRHLLTCASCREEEKRLLGLRKGIEEEPPELGPKLRARLEAVVAGRTRRRAARLFGRPIPLYAAAAACVVVALIARAVPGGPARMNGAAPAATIESDPFPPFSVAESYQTGLAWGEYGGENGIGGPRERTTPMDSL